MATQNFLIDGVSIQNYAYNIVNRSRGYRVPGHRMSNLTLPGVHGTTWVPGKPYEENTLVLTMWALGANTDGTVPTDSQAKVRANLDALLQIFFPGRLINVRQVMNGATRECYGEVQAAIDFTTMAGGTRAEFGVEIIVPKVFWRDTTNTTQTFNVGAITDTTVNATSFSTSTAPLTEMTYEVVGPITNPIITNPVSGQWVKYVGGIGAGVTWSVNSANWTSVLNSSSNVIGSTQHGNGATFLDLSPNSAGPQIRLQGTGTTSATVLRVIGKNSYLIA